MDGTGVGTRRPLPRQGWADHNLQNGCVSPHPSLRGCFCLNGVSVGLGSLSSQGTWFFRMHFFAGQLTGAFSPSFVFSDLPRRAQTLFLSCRAQGGFLRMPGEKVLGLVATDMSHVLIAHFFFFSKLPSRIWCRETARQSSRPTGHLRPTLSSTCLSSL